ncbi:MAG: hypothetical protein U1F98_13300 [Verrucomicrobiota bacterium]
MSNGDIDGGSEEHVVRCPVCGIEAYEECQHLFMHGDDLRTQEVIDFTGPDGALEELNRLAPRSIPEFAASFFGKFGQHFKSLVDYGSCEWSGGAPGLSGNYCYVWVRSKAALCNEVNRFLEERIARLRARRN